MTISKQNLTARYTGRTEKEYCDYLYDTLRSVIIHEDEVSRDLTTRQVYCIKTAMMYAYTGNKTFYHELADFFRGKVPHNMELPVTYTEKIIFIMLYELASEYQKDKTSQIQ